MAAERNVWVFPTAGALRPLTPGCTVHVKQRRSEREEKGVVLSGPGPDGRYEVRYSDGETHSVRRCKMLPVYPSGSAVICADTVSFRRLAHCVPTKADAAVDVGCARGEATAALAARCGATVGIDISEEEIAAAAAAHGDVARFVQADCIGPHAAEQLAAAAPQPPGGGRLIVLVDVGGSRPAADTLRAVHAVATLRPQVVVVKSKALHHAALAQGVSEDGRVSGGMPWLSTMAAGAEQAHQEALAAPGVFPLYQPQRCTADGTRICRFHSYDQCAAPECRFSHAHCNHCGVEGHRALECPEWEARRCARGEPRPAAAPRQIACERAWHSVQQP